MAHISQIPLPLTKKATSYILDLQSRIRKGEQVDYTQIKKLIWTAHAL